VNVAKSWFTVAAPDYWLYFLGTLFIVVTLYFPKGFTGMLARFNSKEKSKESA
jgi:urea transport system permease protein